MFLAVAVSWFFRHFRAKEEIQTPMTPKVRDCHLCRKFLTEEENNDGLSKNDGKWSYILNFAHPPGFPLHYVTSDRWSEIIKFLLYDFLLFVHFECLFCCKTYKPIMITVTIIHLGFNQLSFSIILLFSNTPNKTGSIELHQMYF